MDSYYFWSYFFTSINSVGVFAGLFVGWSVATSEMRRAKRLEAVAALATSSRMLLAGMGFLSASSLIGRFVVQAMYFSNAPEPVYLTVQGALLPAIGLVGTIVFLMGTIKRIKVNSPEVQATNSRKSLLFGTLALLAPGWVLQVILTFGRNIDTDAISADFSTFAFVGLFLLDLGFCFYVAETAKAKGRSWAVFFVLCLLVSPILIWIVAASLSPVSNKSAQAADTEPMAQIKQLADLLAQGILTQEEFDKKKAVLLERL